MEREGEADTAAHSATEGSEPTAVVGFDPLAGLDPAAQDAFVLGFLSDDEDAFWATYASAMATLSNETVMALVAQAAHRITAVWLATALIQIAKEGLTVAFGRSRVDKGRFVDPTSLRVSVVIWEARNQTMHWPEGNLHQPVQDVFDALIAHAGPQFADYKTRSMALEVVELLDWRDVSSFRQDLESTNS